MLPDSFNSVEGECVPPCQFQLSVRRAAGVWCQQHWHCLAWAHHLQPDDCCMRLGCGQPQHISLATRCYAAGIDEVKAERRKLLEGMLARPPKVSCVRTSVSLTAELQPHWGRAGDVCASCAANFPPPLQMFRARGRPHLQRCHGATKRRCSMLGLLAACCRPDAARGAVAFLP